MTPSKWWMYHGDPAHTGEVTGSELSSRTIHRLKVRDVPIRGPVLSVPALADGKIYVGLANTSGTPGVNGGHLLKIDATTGKTEGDFKWTVPCGEGESHGFMGMGCTPAVTAGRVYFFGFNAKLYCLEQASLKLVWVTDLRSADPRHGQPISNTLRTSPDDPNASGWSSPLVVHGKVYVGTGEGENKALFGLVFCLDADTGNVEWIYCTVQLHENQPNLPNQIPECIVPAGAPPKFCLDPSRPRNRGCSVWSSIAYDESLHRIFCATGNPGCDTPLPTAGFSNGILALDASSGAYKAFFQPPASSSYRPSDNDVDFGGSPMLYTLNGRRVVVAGCKNGGFFLLDAASLQLLKCRQLLPFRNDGRQIETVDPHFDGKDTWPSNESSNRHVGENFYGTYSTPAVHSRLGRLFIGVGGNNYHNSAPGIDAPTTPFMRAMNWESLDDVWPMDDSDPRRYAKSHPPMYSVPGEAGLSSPVVVNDLVFCSTSLVALYAFSVHDGTCLWRDRLGQQTGGLSGGYGYCLGPAIEGNFVVAGGLIFGRNGGVLRIYSI